MYEKFVLHMDNAALQWFLTINEPSGRLMRWSLRLTEFYFKVKYKKGLLNTQTDTLLRLTTSVETIDEDDDRIPAFMEEVLSNELERDKERRNEQEFLIIQYLSLIHI